MNGLTAIRWTTLEVVLGGLHYMGSCPCGRQHMSRNARVAVRPGRHEIYCESCGRKAEAHDGQRRQVSP